MYHLPEVLMEIKHRLKRVEYHQSQAAQEFDRLSCLVMSAEKKFVHPYVGLAVVQRWKNREKCDRLEQEEYTLRWEIDTCNKCDYDMICKQCRFMIQKLASVREQKSKLEEQLGEKEYD